jgi:hypothetical protein
MSVKVIIRTTFVPTMPDLRLRGDLLEAVELMVHLLKPASMAAFLLAFWRFGADLGWTNEFLIESGVFSRWQLWAALGAAMIAAQSQLSRRLTVTD